MGSLVPVFSNNIKMEDLTLDFSLEAARGDYPDQITSYDGKETIGSYKDGEGFGITSIEIDTSLNMQPQIEITFKDLYGNLVFKSGSNSNYSKLFELPPPKFTLTFKGYVGKPIQYMLQLRSTSINYVPSDGSYEIKCKFVPNIYGFFGDIPYKFVYSVDKLKTARGTALNSSSILNIIKNGDTVNEKVQTASEQFDKLKKQLTSLASGDGETIYNDLKAGLFSSNGSTPFEIASPLNNTALNGTSFKPISINLTNQAASEYTKHENLAPIKVPRDGSFEYTYTNLYGLSVFCSIATTVNTTGVNLNANAWANLAVTLSKAKRSDIAQLITDNLKAIDDATAKSAGTQISQEVLDSQTISSVMSGLAGEAAYVLGYILEGAILGRDADTNRTTNEKLIGLYYPLVYQTNNTAGANGETVYEQVPDPKASIEMQYVQAFMKAQYEGTQQVKKYNEEQEAKQSGTEGAIQQGSELKKRITNAEAFKANPYAKQSSDRICINMIQRSGLIGTRMCGPVEGETDYKNDRKKGLIDSEYENIKFGTDVLTGTDLESMRTFAKRVTTFFDANGSPKYKWTDFTDSGNTTTYQTYFQSFFEGMKTGGLDNNMFLNSNPNTLTCNYFICNDVLYQNENDLGTIFGKKDVYVYVPSDKATLTSTLNSTGATDISETLNGKSADTTKPYESDFFAFQKATEWDGLGDASNPTLVVSYDKLTSRSYVPAKDMTMNIAKTAATGVVAAADADFVAPLVELSKAGSFKTFVLAMKDKPDTVAPLVSWCTRLLRELPQTDPEAARRKAEQEKKAASGGNGDGGSMETQNAEPYTFDANVYNAIYHQFHHIASAWSSILDSSLKGQDWKGLAKSKKLAEAMEEAYRNDKPNANLLYSMSFAMAVQMSNVTNESLKKAIINTSLMRETDTESSTFTMMSNIAQQNNFLLQSIPGGLKSGSDEFDIDSLFTPIPSYEKSSAVGSASLCFIWQPTPESRSLNNKSEFIYGDTEKFKASLDSLPGNSKVAWLQFGSPDNIIVKSIKATTDENKVTGESIAAVDDIINPQNQSKKRAFDCSMLSVMQGRSYKIGMEILGNANFLPTQRFAITNLPIFTGLYWTSNVKHSITPNNMVTNIEAMKLKYDGGNFGGVLPITSDRYKGDTKNFGGGGANNTGGGGPNTGGGENILSDGLNWDFLQKVKDEKMRNASEINAFIKKYTSNKFNHYPTWFNSQIAKKKQFCDSVVPSKEWTHVWDTIIPIVYPKYGNGGINFLEFLAMNMIIYGETGAAFTPVSEHMNNLTNPIPGIAYAFNKIPNKKATYNKPANKLASELFSDPKFISAHGSLPFGNDNRVLRSKNAAWAGSAFPLDQFATDKNAAVNPDSATFINQADFFKYRGRGYIGTTWRDGYQKVVEYILAYIGSDTTLVNYKGKFKTAPYNGNVQDILTMTTNEDWDTIFRSSNVIPGWAIYNHASRRHDYQYFTDLTQSREVLQNKLYKVGLYVNGDQTGKYEQKHMMRVYQQLDELSPSTKVVSNNSSNSNSNYTPPPPPAGTS